MPTDSGQPVGRARSWPRCIQSSAASWAFRQVKALPILVAMMMARRTWPLERAVSKLRIRWPMARPYSLRWKARVPKKSLIQPAAMAGMASSSAFAAGRHGGCKPALSVKAAQMPAAAPMMSMRTGSGAACAAAAAWDNQPLAATLLPRSLATQACTQQASARACSDAGSGAGAPAPWASSCSAWSAWYWAVSSSPPTQAPSAATSSSRARRTGTSCGATAGSRARTSLASWRARTGSRWPGTCASAVNAGRRALPVNSGKVFSHCARSASHTNMSTR